jgi:hypothetical protein
VSPTIGMTTSLVSAPGAKVSVPEAGRKSVPEIA